MSQHQFRELNVVLRPDMLTDVSQSAYKGFATAWNSHVDVIDWRALCALIAGGLAALVAVYIYRCFICGCLFEPFCGCMSRTNVQLQCPVVIHIAPTSDKLPRLRDPRAPIVRRGGKNNTVAATASQWNNMRVALGPNVPNKALTELLQKHGSDTHAAVEDYFGLQAGSRW